MIDSEQEIRETALDSTGADGSEGRNPSRGTERAAEDPVVKEGPGDGGSTSQGVSGAGEVGGAERVTGEAANAEGAGPFSAEVNQSLARLEMNSLQVKLYLDSIEQRISRMEPRLEGMRPPEEATQPEGAPAGEPPQQNLDSTPFRPEVSTTERRRRAQGVPVERRRPPVAAVPEPEVEGALDWKALTGSLRGRRALVWRQIEAHRRWVGAAGIALLAIAGWMFLSSGQPSTRKAPLADAGTMLTGVVPAVKPKSSADVPWSAKPEAGRPAPGRSSAPHASTQGGSPVVEQGVLAPSATGTGNVPSGNVPSGDATLVKAASGVGTDAEEGTKLPGDATEMAAADPGGAHSASATSPRIIPPGGKRIQVSSGVMAGNLIFSRQPTYPHGLAGMFHTQGPVVMQAIIAKNGRVQNLRVISGHYLLRGAAKDAVRTWRYRPYMVNGTPVEVATIVSVEFRH